MVTVVIRLHGRFDDAGGQAGFPWIFGSNWRPLMRQFRTKFVPACHIPFLLRSPSLPALSLSALYSLPVSPFYRAMLCMRGICYGPDSQSVYPSVRPSVTSRCSITITQTTPHDSAGTLVFWCQRYPRNSTGIIPCGGSKCRWAGSESATFDK